MAQRNDIWRAIQRGPVTREELEVLTGLPDRRVRRIVASLASKGYPVVPSPGGYKVGTPAEVRAEARILRSTARAINHRADALMQGLQEVLF